LSVVAGRSGDKFFAEPGVRLAVAGGGAESNRLIELSGAEWPRNLAVSIFVTASSRSERLSGLSGPGSLMDVWRISRDKMMSH